MEVFFSTVVRAAAQERGGEVVRLDWRTKEVLARAPVWPVDPSVSDPNPRGSTRGGRGILLNGHEVLVASYHSLLVLTEDLRPKGRITHNLFANLHEIGREAGDIWVASTDLDVALKIGADGALRDTWWPREDPLTATRYALAPLAIDKDVDQRARFVGTSNTAPGHVHLNAVTIHEGEPTMLLNRCGCIVKPRSRRILVDDPMLRGAHNLVALADGRLLVNNTVHRALHVYRADGSLEKIVVLTQYPIVRLLLRREMIANLTWWLKAHGKPHRLCSALFGRFATARPVFMRGLCVTPRQTLLIGISPATVLEIDLESERLLDSFTYSTDRHVCVHGLACRETNGTGAVGVPKGDSHAA